MQVRPGLDLKQRQYVARGLRQFFLAYLKGSLQRVAMPSQVVDDLWHEFILFTREYQMFCERAFGRFLHHTPAVAMRHSRVDNEGLRRVWWQCCLEENIKPRKATSSPRCHHTVDATAATGAAVTAGHSPGSAVSGWVRSRGRAGRLAH